MEEINQVKFLDSKSGKVVKIFMSLRNLLRRMTDFIVLTLIFIKDKSPEYIKIIY